MNSIYRLYHAFVPDFLSIDEVRKRQFFGLCIAFAIPLLIGFTIVDYYEGDQIEMGLDIILMMLLTSCFVGIIKFNADFNFYRTTLTLISMTLLYAVSLGAGNETILSWTLIVPILYLFFFGKKEGLAWTITFCTLLLILIINPLGLAIHNYGLPIGLRLVTAFLFVGIIAYGLEASRYKYSMLFKAEQEKLTEEKIRLERALDTVKTLTGLLPICANCKKIRDDDGYWREVEVYIRDHSEAELSHGICPPCSEKLYPELYKHIND